MPIKQLIIDNKPVKCVVDGEGPIQCLFIGPGSIYFPTMPDDSKRNLFTFYDVDSYFTKNSKERDQNNFPFLEE